MTNLLPGITFCIRISYIPLTYKMNSYVPSFDWSPCHDNETVSCFKTLLISPNGSNSSKWGLASVVMVIVQEHTVSTNMKTLSEILLWTYSGDLGKGSAPSCMHDIERTWSV